MLSAIVGSFPWTTVAAFAAAARLWPAITWWSRRHGATASTRIAGAMAVLSLLGTFFPARDGTRLGATLYVPAKGGPHRAILIVSGAGSKPREVYDLNTDYFARRGFIIGLSPRAKAVGSRLLPRCARSASPS